MSGNQRTLVFSGMAGEAISNRVDALRCLAHHGGVARMMDIATEAHLDYSTFRRQLPLLEEAGVAEGYEEHGVVYIRLVPVPLTPLGGEHARLWACMWEEWVGGNMHLPISHRTIALKLSISTRQVSHLLRALEGKGWVELRTHGTRLLAAPSLPSLANTLRESPEWELLTRKKVCLEANTLLEEARRAFETNDLALFVRRIAQAHLALAPLQGGRTTAS